jgi:hypothetical protein
MDSSQVGGGLRSRGGEIVVVEEVLAEEREKRFFERRFG